MEKIYRYIIFFCLLFCVYQLGAEKYFVNSITVKNLNQTSQKQVLRNLHFQVGQTIEAEHVSRALWRLNNEELWQNVDIALLPSENAEESSPQNEDNKNNEDSSKQEDKTGDDFHEKQESVVLKVDVVVDVTEKNPWLIFLEGWPAITTDRNARQMLLFAYIVTQGILDYRIFNMFNKDIDFRLFYNFVSGPQFLKTEGFPLGLNFLDMLRANTDIKRLFDSSWSLKLKWEYGQPLREHYYAKEKQAVYRSEEIKIKTGLEYKLGRLYDLGRFATFDFFHEASHFQLLKTIENPNDISFVGKNSEGLYNTLGSMITLSSRRLATSMFHFTLEAPFEYTFEDGNLHKGFFHWGVTSHFSLNTDLISIDLLGGYRQTMSHAPLWFQNKMATMKYMVTFHENRVRGYLTDFGLYNEGFFASLQTGIAINSYTSVLFLSDAGYALSSADSGSFFMLALGTGLDLKVSPVANVQLYLLINQDKKLTALAGIKKRL